MKQLSTEKEAAIINGIINSEIPSKTAQAIAQYLKAEFSKLSVVEEKK